LGFVLGAFLYEGLIRRRYLLAVFCLLSGAAVPVAGAWFFVRHLRDGFLIKLPFAEPKDVLSPALVLFLILPLVPVITWVAGWYRGRLRATEAAAPSRPVASRVPQGKRHKAAPAPARSRLDRFRPKALVSVLSHPLVLALAGQTLALADFDHKQKRLTQVDYYSFNREWGKVLKAGYHVTGYNQSMVADINRALCQTGRLCYDMFAYPQRVGYDLWLWLHSGIDTRQCMKVSDILFELGQINKSERMACEALEIVGYRPETLQRMALIKVLKDQPDAARIFLNLLRKSLFHRRWAAAVLEALDRDPKLGTWDEVSRVRLYMITEDYYGNHTTEAILLQSLRQNRLNRMAFEYLMAFYLLNQQLDKVYLNISRLGDFHYPEIPRHVEEALLLHQRLTGKPLSLRGNRIKPQTERRFQEFHERFMSYQGNLQEARLGLMQDFGDTYWFFYMFGCSSWALTQADLNAKLANQP
jgi:hypothetical protein